jgi:hypothetical protein
LIGENSIRHYFLKVQLRWQQAIAGAGASASDQKNGLEKNRLEGERKCERQF